MVRKLNSCDSPSCTLNLTLNLTHVSEKESCNPQGSALFSFLRMKGCFDAVNASQKLVTDT